MGINGASDEDAPFVLELVSLLDLFQARWGFYFHSPYRCSPASSFRRLRLLAPVFTIHSMGAELLSYTEAGSVVTAYARQLRVSPRVEIIDLGDARGRVLARPISADQDQPAFGRSTRDGFACCAGEALQRDWLPVAGSTRAGQGHTGALPPKSAWEIMTGAPVPAGADAVVMLEHVVRDGDRVRLMPDRTLQPGDNIVAQGAQARAGEELVPAGLALGPAQIALGAACGYAKVDVFARPRVAILTTGDELVAIDSVPRSGQIRNSNAPMLEALVAAAGGRAWVLPSVADTAEALDTALLQAMPADLLLISGGVSAGKFDLVEPALARLAAKFFFTGVRIQPGKPLVFGVLRAADPSASIKSRTDLPFFGLPGNPISSAATFLVFASQVLRALAGSCRIEPQLLAARLTEPTDRKAKPGLTRFLPARYEFAMDDGQLPGVTTVPWHGSGDLPAFARSNCFLVVPEPVASLDAGATVRILPF